MKHKFRASPSCHLGDTSLSSNSHRPKYRGWSAPEGPRFNNLSSGDATRIIIGEASICNKLRYTGYEIVAIVNIQGKLIIFFNKIFYRYKLIKQNGEHMSQVFFRSQRDKKLKRNESTQ